MSLFDKGNYIVNKVVIEHVFKCSAKVIQLAKLIELWTL